MANSSIMCVVCDQYAREGKMLKCRRCQDRLAPKGWLGGPEWLTGKRVLAAAALCAIVVLWQASCNQFNQLSEEYWERNRLPEHEIQAHENAYRAMSDVCVVAYRTMPAASAKEEIEYQVLKNFQVSIQELRDISMMSTRGGVDGGIVAGMAVACRWD